MNKKFSTLVACLLAGTAFSTAVATDFSRPIEYRTAYVGAGISGPSATIDHIKADQWYQLRTTLSLKGNPTGVLVHERDAQTGEVSLRVRTEGSAPLLPSLWRIEYTENDGVGGGKFQFVNKETNIAISFDHTFAAFTDENGTVIAPEGAKWIMGDCSLNWEWYNNNKQQTGDFAETAPYSYIHTNRDSVMILKMGAGGYVSSYKDASSKILNNHSVAASAGALKIQPVVAKDITLSAQAFNSMIDYNKPSWSQYAQFLFFKPNGDLLNAEKMSPKTNGVMEEGQNYEAQYDWDALEDIFKMAIEDLGGDYKYEDYKDRIKASIMATEALKKADFDLSRANQDLSESEGTLRRIESDQQVANAKYEVVIEAVKKYALINASNDATNAYMHFVSLDSKKVTVAGYTVNLLDKVKSESGKQAELKAAVVEAKKAYDEASATTNTTTVINAAIELTSAVNAVIADLVTDETKLVAANVAEFNTVFGAYKAEFAAAINNYTEVDKANTAQAVALEKELTSLAQRISAAKEALGGYKAAQTSAQKAYLAAVSAKEKADKAWSTAKEAWAKTKYILEEGFMRLNYVESATKRDKYLMVDTAFWQTKTQGQAIPSRSDLVISNKVPQAKDAAAIDARYFFKLTYFPTQDSLVVEPLNASVISNEEYAAKTLWKDSYVGNHFAYKANVGVNAEAASNSWTTDKSPVALKLEELSTSDWCLTAATVNPEFDSWLKTRIAFNNPYGYLQRATLKEGLYKVMATNKGKYVVANFQGRFQYDVEEENIQNYDDMPATMFVVKKAGCKDADRVAIFNREFGWEYAPAFIGQLYMDEDSTLFTINKNYPNSVDGPWNKLALKDNYKFEAVTDEDALTSNYHGYNHLDPETLKYTNYSLKYNWSLNDNLYLNADANGLLAYSEGANTTFELDTVLPDLNWRIAVEDFGYGAGVANLKQLKRNLYTLKVSDANLIDNDTTYVALVKEKGKNEYYTALGINEIRAGKGQLAIFYLKADQVNSDGEKAYVLIDAREGSTYYYGGIRQANCIDGNQRLSHIDLNNAASERASAFALEVNDRPLYKAIDANKNVNIFRTIGTAKQYLFEDNSNKIGVSHAKAGFGFLGLTQEDINQGNGNTTALYVDEVLSSNARMPQYMFVVDIDSVENGKWCDDHGYNPGCEHEVYYNGYLAGRFLVNLTDSITAGTNLETNADQYKYQSFTRLGFVEGVHMYIDKDEAKEMDKAEGEYFFTLNKGVALADLKDKDGKIIPAKLFDGKLAQANMIGAGKHNNYSFSLRLKNDTEDGFYLESNKAGVSSIGSFKGAWVKEMNGVLVLAQTGSDNGDHNQQGGNIQEIVNQAQYFQIENTDDVATSNEGIETATISVVATNGAVIVKGAAGKKVAISNVLGQTIANTTVTSDEATIAAPAGVVVVAVEGEAAVKAIVK